MLILLLISVVYLFLIFPAFRRRQRRGMPAGLYAHRGLYDNMTDIPENSMAAFRAAALRGYGIELDVQRTLDGVAVVFHDSSALRMCGEDLTIADHTWEELSHLRLLHTREGIPLLSDVIQAIQAPLLLDIKPAPQKSRRRHIAEKTARCIWRQMDGAAQPIAIQSVDGGILRWFRHHVPALARGHVHPAGPAARSRNGQQKRIGRKSSLFPRLEAFLVRHNLLHHLSRPDFIVMDFHETENIGMRICDDLLRTPLAACIVKDEAQLKYCRDTGYSVWIFDSFLPETHQENEHPAP